MLTVLPSTDARVQRHSAPEANARMRQDALQRLKAYEHADAPRISARISELEREWDIERVLEANAASAALIGLALGATVDRRWFALPAAVAGFLLQHALQGWCPPLPLFRRLGVRTAREIHEEIVALKVMRGDFAAAARDSGHVAEQARFS
jgi:hypothetical protein